MSWIWMILAMVVFLMIAVMLWFILLGADDPSYRDLNEQQEVMEQW